MVAMDQFGRSIVGFYASLRIYLDELASCHNALLVSLSNGGSRCCKTNALSACGRIFLPPEILNGRPRSAI